MDKKAKIYIAGHNGMVGSAIKRKLESLGYEKIIYKTSEEMDLRNQSAVREFFVREKPEYVFLAAAKVGGIMANYNFPAEFLYDNLAIETNVIHYSMLTSVKKLLFLGSACIYPKFAPQPIKEEHLLTGSLEPTNEPYAIAKIAGLKMCEYYYNQYRSPFISLMPNNLYGPNDNYDLDNSHVLPALIKKIHLGKIFESEKVEIWGTGSPLREFLHVDDLADACVFVMDKYEDVNFLNVGSGEEISIKNLAYLIKKIIGYKGEFEFNTNKPDGTPRKLIDISKLTEMGWKSKIKLEEGIRTLYNNIKDKI